MTRESDRAFQQHRKGVLLVGTGGTLAAEPRDVLDWIDYSATGRYRPIAEIVGEVSAMLPGIPISSVDVLQRDSSEIGPEDWLLLGEKVEEMLCDDGIAGAVIVHGTSTLEEAAYFLHLTCTTAKPIILTGAQRPLSTVSSDGLANLLAAICAAQSPQCTGTGVLVVFNSEIHAARDVTKEGTYELGAFRSRNTGPLGCVGADGSVNLLRRPTKRGCPDTDFSRNVLGSLPRVDIVMSYAGCDGYAIDASVSAGARAIIHAGLSPGLPTKAEAKAIDRARDQNVLVVQASRGRQGVVHQSERMQRLGIISALDHSPQKARLIVMLSLAINFTAADIAEALAAY